MAEQPDVEIPVEDSNDDELETPGYKPPAKKTLEEIQQQDADDESLVRYKKTLLGQVEKLKDDGGPNVIVQKLNINMSGGPAMELDLTGELSQLKKKPFIFKEKAPYKVQITFRVQREIVAGLRYSQKTYRKGIKVDSAACMVGSYGPKVESYEYLTPEEETPSGLVARGHYNVKSQFLDDDKNVILEWEWAFEIKKDFA
ncbi:rho GDP-dissociation inhibitor 1-like [Lineus longissimus]|uniref:rho GDP-dissociation inhibitor 1-like n=1 Tax=Lineus longissimus TaxID=88925 RepID=UPI002B4C2ABB